MQAEPNEPKFGLNEVRLSKLQAERSFRQDLTSETSFRKRGSIMGDAMQSLQRGRTGSISLDHDAVHEVFDSLDTGKDGTIDEGELYTALDSLGLFDEVWDGLGLPEDPMERTRNAILNFDKTGSGNLSMDEFADLIAELRDLRDTFKQLRSSASKVLGKPGVEQDDVDDALSVFGARASGLRTRSRGSGRLSGRMVVNQQPPVRRSQLPTTKDDSDDSD